MATSYSTNLALALPATGELSGTWGTTVNANITNMLDEALGYQAFSATGSSDTLTIPDGTTGVARSIYIQLNGTGGGTVNVPTAKTKMYFVFNNTASAITFKVTSQTGVSIPAAAKIALVSNGTDIITAENYLAALTLGAALPVASGGTSLTTLTANNVILGNGTSAPTFVAPSTSGNVLTSNGTTWQSTASPASAMILISTQTASAASSVVFSSGITYNRYILYGRNIFSASGNPRLYLNVNAITSNYDTAFLGISSSAIYQDTTGGGTGVLILPQTTQTNTSMNNFVLEMAGLSGTGEKSFVGSSFLYNPAIAAKMAGTIGGNLVTTTAASSFTLAFDSGTLNGVFSLYGVTV